MEQLWAPWRLAYVTGASGSHNECVFCNTFSDGRDQLILIRGRFTYVVLNKYPYNNGHLMVVTSRHVANLAGATPDELAELMRFTRIAEMALNEAYSPQGINVGINLGRPAGAGIVDHLHIHLVPRWSGDTSFMTAIGNVRVLPEDLEATGKRLRPIFERLAERER